VANYPQIIFNLKKLEHNAKQVITRCDKAGIRVAGVTKGVAGDLKIARTFLDQGAAELASSRTDHLKLYKEELDTRTLLLRIPMLDELDEVLESADRSLQSDLKTLKALAKRCEDKAIHHGVILMMDLGDLREGFFEPEELFEAASFVDEDPYLELVGIGTNLGCYGSIRPTRENLGRLVDLAESIETEIIHRSLEVISGGATSSLTLLYDDEMPPRINHLRIGEGILLARDLTDFWGYDQDDLINTTMRIKAQIIEIKDKPSYPVGEIAIDAFGNRPTYEDIGERKRALLALGKQDMGDHEKLIPTMAGVTVVGSSSDHLIVDITESEKVLRVGDTLSFYPYYQAMLFASIARDVKKAYE
jgi:predicted amino acid racemase